MSRREDFLTTARALFARQGFSATSTRDICAELGLAHSAVYNYFDSKEHLLFELASQAMTEMQAELDTILDGLEAAAPLSRLEAAIRFTLRSAATRQLEWRIVVDEVRNLNSKRYRREIVSRRDKYDQILRSLMDACIANGDLPAQSNPKLADFALGGIADGMAVWYQPDGPLACDQLVDYFTAFVLGGLRGAGELTPRGRPAAGAQRSPVPRRKATP